MPWCKISGGEGTQEAVWGPQWNGGHWSNGGSWSNEGPLVITASCDSPRSVTSPAFVDCPRTFIASLLCLELALHYALTFSVTLHHVTFSAPKTPCPSCPHQTLVADTDKCIFSTQLPMVIGRLTLCCDMFHIPAASLAVAGLSHPAHCITTTSDFAFLIKTFFHNSGFCQIISDFT